jgi:phosphatidylinositol alpha-mannosyltransferase
MKIAQVSPYDHAVPGGVREHVNHLSAALAALGHEVKILAPASRRAELPANFVCMSDLLIAMRASGSTVRITPSPAAYCRVWHLLAVECFDVVHIHEPLMPAVSLGALMHSRAVTIGHIHGLRGTHPVCSIACPWLRRLMDRLDARAAVSLAAMRGAARYFAGTYHIIPDGVDVDRFGASSVAPLKRFADGKLNILFVGRMDPRKGLPHLLHAYALVRAVVPNTRLIVAGAYSRAEQAPWEALARRCGWRDVEFVGYVPPEQMPNYYRSAHLFCAPSTGFEALGIVLLEAMASGTPIVASDIEGYRTAVTSGREGMLVTPGDPPALAQSLVELLKDPERRGHMGEQGRLTSRRYAWPAVAQQTLELYESALWREPGAQQGDAASAQGTSRPDSKQQYMDGSATHTGAGTVNVPVLASRFIREQMATRERSSSAATVVLQPH